MKILLLLLPFLLFAVPHPPGRPSKAPFISGDAFRAYADYVYDEVDRSLNPEEMRPYSTIFVKIDFVKTFFEKLHPKIPGPYVLITHNGDAPMPGGNTAALDDEKLLAWFGMSWDGTEHPKIHQIPIGIANFCWPHGNAQILSAIQTEKPEKTHLAHMNFATGTFPSERLPLAHRLRISPYIYAPKTKSFPDFIRDVASSHFEISPRGNSPDTHRLWEALYVGTIPVVKTSQLDSLYEGLPVLIIPDWSLLSETYLRARLAEKKAYSLEKLSMDYWIQEIEKTLQR